MQSNTKLTPAQVKKIFENTVATIVNMSPDEIDLHASFASGLGLDSLDEVELLMYLEQQFQIKIPDEETHALYGATVYDVLEECVKLLVAAKRLTEQDAKIVLSTGVFNKKSPNTPPKTAPQPKPDNRKPQPQMVTIPKSLLDATLNDANALLQTATALAEKTNRLAGKMRMLLTRLKQY